MSLKRMWMRMGNRLIMPLDVLELVFVGENEKHGNFELFVQHSSKLYSTPLIIPYSNKEDRDLAFDSIWNHLHPKPKESDEESMPSEAELGHNDAPHTTSG